MGDDLLVGRPILLQHVLDQIDPPARAIELVAERHIGRAGRRAETAMHAFADDAFRMSGVRVGELGGREAGLHVLLLLGHMHTEASIGVHSDDLSSFYNT